MKSASNHPKRFTVTKHNTTLTVYPYTGSNGRPGWRFAWRDSRDGGKWKYVTRRTREEAKAAALEKLDETSWGKLAWSSLPPERRRFLTAIHDDTHADDEERVRDFAYSLRRQREELARREAAGTPDGAAKSDHFG